MIWALFKSASGCSHAYVAFDCALQIASLAQGTLREARRFGLSRFCGPVGQSCSALLMVSCPFWPYAAAAGVLCRAPTPSAVGRQMAGGPAVGSARLGTRRPPCGYRSRGQSVRMARRPPGMCPSSPRRAVLSTVPARRRLDAWLHVAARLAPGASQMCAPGQAIGPSMQGSSIDAMQPSTSAGRSRGAALSGVGWLASLSASCISWGMSASPSSGCRKRRTRNSS